MKRLLCALAVLFTATPAAAENLGWLAPPDLPPRETNVQGVRTHSFFGEVEGVARSFVLAILPRAGGFATAPIVESARAVSERNGSRTCTRYEFLDWRELQIDGRSAVQWTWRCDGPIGNGEVMAFVNYRRVLMLEGETQVYQAQFDAYVPNASSLTATEALAFSEPLLAAMRWCPEDQCAPRAAPAQ